MPASPARGLLRWFYLLLACASLGLGVAGLFLPVLPTVPFVLLAAWAAARSSPRMHAWLEAHRVFGPPIRDWRNGGIVRRRAKWLATLLMAASACSLWWFVRPRWPVGAAIVGMVAVLVWLWRRPEVTQG